MLKIEPPQKGGFFVFDDWTSEKCPFGYLRGSNSRIEVKVLSRLVSRPLRFRGKPAGKS